MRNFSWIVGQGSPWHSPNNTGYCCCLCLSPRSSKGPFAEDTIHFRYRTERNQAVSVPKSPPQRLASIVSGGAVQVAKGGKHSIIPPAVTPVSHNDDHHIEISLKVQWWHLCVGGSLQLSNWTLGWLNKKKTCLVTENLTNHLLLVSS